MRYLKPHSDHAEGIELYLQIVHFWADFFLLFVFLVPSNRIPEYSELTHKDHWVQLFGEWPEQGLNPWPWVYQHHALNEDFTMILKNASFFPKPVLTTLRKMLFSLAVWSLKFIWGILFRDRNYLAFYTRNIKLNKYYGFCRHTKEKTAHGNLCKAHRKAPWAALVLAQPLL